MTNQGERCGECGGMGFYYYEGEQLDCGECGGEGELTSPTASTPPTLDAGVVGASFYAIANLLDHYDQLANDIKTDPGFETLRNCIEALRGAHLSLTTPGGGESNVGETEYGPPPASVQIELVDGKYVVKWWSSNTSGNYVRTQPDPRDAPGLVAELRAWADHYTIGSPDRERPPSLTELPDLMDRAAAEIERLGKDRDEWKRLTTEEATKHGVTQERAEQAEADCAEEAKWLKLVKRQLVELQREKDEAEARAKEYATKLAEAWTERDALKGKRQRLRTMLFNTLDKCPECKSEMLDTSAEECCGLHRALAGASE